MSVDDCVKKCIASALGGYSEIKKVKCEVTKCKFGRLTLGVIFGENEQKDKGQKSCWVAC